MITKKQQEISLTWKYFWKQKIQELLIIPGVTLIFFILALSVRFLESLFVLDSSDLICVELEGVGCWIGYAFSGAMAAMLVIMLLVILIVLVREFIISNWEKAQKRAKKEMKFKKLKGGKKYV